MRHRTQNSFLDYPRIGSNGTNYVKYIVRTVAAVIITFVIATSSSHADFIIDKFELDSTSTSIHLGFGQTADIPRCTNCPLPRRSHRFISLIAAYERNLTGVNTQDSTPPGALFWRIEGGLASITDDHTSSTSPYLINFSPLIVQYRLLPTRTNWGAKLLGGLGFASTNWRDYGGQPLNSSSQFLVHLGVGVESYQINAPFSIDYRLLHVSNGGSGHPNIGINAHLISVSFEF
ncbi:MAG: hypothetical protein CL398_05045 [Acidiferrobacteraceae bacterium]|nr:hypothetical protein [Acidiferrobacteraceae bacterium]